VSRRRQIGSRNAQDATPRFIALSRVLIALIGLLLLATPWTEGYRLLDNFPRGQDSEVHLLALLVFLGLVLLLARSRTQSVAVILSVASWISAILQHILRISFGLERTSVASVRHAPPIPNALHATFQPPLRI
jgi:hypothetical protein